MMRSLYSGISGIRAHQVKLDVVANNISNVNTVGFKSSRVTFQDVLSQTMRTSFVGDGVNYGGVNGAQLGLGVSVGSIDVLYDTGGTQTTDRAFDVAIAEDGFFMVQTGGNTYYTRAGSFYLDGDGYLVTANGEYVLNSSGGTIQIDSTAYTDLSIDKTGNITGVDTNGDIVTLDTLGIAKFTNNSGLMKIGNNLYKETSNSGAPVVGTPGSNGFSVLIPGALEMSNVDLSREFTDMIIAQRGYQANARVITTSNSLLEELVNIVR